jgi:hypothetical protein
MIESTDRRRTESVEVIGLESIATDLSQPIFLVKCLLSEKTVVFFPASTQHADVRVAGLRYEDESKGNALAATMTSKRFGIRLHAKFSAAAVARIVQQLLERDDMLSAKETPVFYGSQNLAV